MSSHLKRGAAALALAACGLSFGGAAQAATVTLSNWAYGNSSNTVTVGSPDHTGGAGAFRGVLRFIGNESGFSGLVQNFVTYCVEIDESFSLPGGNMTGYSVIEGASYGKWNNANGSGNLSGDTAMRLGQLLSWASHHGDAVDSAAESTSMQLAIWNLIYDTDSTVGSGLFSEKSGSAYNAYADTLLGNAASWTQMLDVFVLSKAGSQDFVLTRDTQQTVPDRLVQQQVPEPASLALVAVALGAAGVASRRRARRG